MQPIIESKQVFYRLGIKRFWIIFASACLSWHAFFLIVPTCFKFLHFGLALGWHCFGVSFVTCLHDYSVILQHSSARNIIFWEICFKRLKKRKIIPRLLQVIENVKDVPSPLFLYQFQNTDSLQASCNHFAKKQI